MKKKIAAIIGVLVSIIAIVAVCYGVNWSQFFEILKKAKHVYVIPIIFIFYLSYVFRALRWQYLVPSQPKISFRASYDASAIGALGTFVLPLRAGEFVRPYALSKFEPISFSRAFASVVTERVFDVLSILVLLSLCFLKLKNVPELVTLGAQSLGLLAGLIVVAMVLAYVAPQKLRFLVFRCCSFVTRRPFSKFNRRVIRHAEEFIQGLRCIRSSNDAFMVVLLSAALWISYALYFQVGVMLLGAETSFWLGATTCVMIALAVAAPSAPGFAGTFQAGSLLAMHVIYGMPKEFSLAYAIAVYILQYVFILGVGFWVLAKRGLSLRELSEK